MIVSIDNKEYHLRYSLRSLFKYEQLTGHPYEGKTLEDAYMLLHASLMSCNPDYSMTFDRLIDNCDLDPSIFAEFTGMVQAEADRLAQLKKKAGPVKTGRKAGNRLV